jgi:CubicO group peptidase (beta-lactamase class C family)
MRCRCLAPAWLCLFIGVHLASAAPVDEKPIDQIVRDALESWQVPGVAIAIVKDGEVIYLKAHGIKKVGKKDPVTRDTVFPIASCTKGFTTAALAWLVDEGKLDWDDPVRQHVPTFHLADPTADADVRLRDLLCHRTGVRGHDFLWYRVPWDQDEAIRRIGLVKQDKPFRTALQYQSIMFMVAGKAIDSVAKAPWSEVVAKRFLNPLEMRNTWFTSTEAEKTKDIASPHRRNDKGEVEVVQRYDEETPNSASSLHTSARDLTQWLMFQLGDGTWKGKQLLSKKNLDEMHMPQIALRVEGSVKDANPATNLMSYGMAWLVQDYHGHNLISHAGAIDGFRTQLFLVPDSKLGIVLLNNLQDTRMNLALGNALIDHILDLPKRDWNTYLLGKLKKEEETARKNLEERFKKRKPDAKPSKELTFFAGEYKDPAYGTCRVSLEDGKLVWRWSTFTCPLEHFAKDSFMTSNPIFGMLFFTFKLNEKGEMASLQSEGLIEVEFKKTR